MGWKLPLHTLHPAPYETRHTLGPCATVNMELTFGHCVESKLLADPCLAFVRRVLCRTCPCVEHGKPLSDKTGVFQSLSRKHKTILDKPR